MTKDSKGIWRLAIGFTLIAAGLVCGLILLVYLLVPVYEVYP